MSGQTSQITGGSGGTGSSQGEPPKEKEKEARYPLEYHVRHARRLYGVRGNIVEAVLSEDRAKTFPESKVKKLTEEFLKAEAQPEPAEPTDPAESPEEE